uniref:Uncharacterized protein n=1 Tax=Glossina austeni TaxID=7395 RepID=A0A1A9VU13_GLOAU
MVTTTAVIYGSATIFAFNAVVITYASTILEQCLNKLANMDSTIEGINMDLLPEFSNLGDVIDISRILDTSFALSNDALPSSTVELDAPTAGSISLPDILYKVL